jgi:cytidine deaminase
MPRAVNIALDPETLQRLLRAARAARAHAHAPYSKFKVGAALLDEQGRVHAGCNIENAAYPQGLCAEAAALAHLVLAGGRRVTAALVVGKAASPVTPCGGCRQKLREFAADDCPVWSVDMRRITARHTLGELLPASFGPSHLGKNSRANAGVTKIAKAGTAKAGIAKAKPGIAKKRSTNGTTGAKRR